MELAPRVSASRPLTPPLWLSWSSRTRSYAQKKDRILTRRWAGPIPDLKGGLDEDSETPARHNGSDRRRLHRISVGTVAETSAVGRSETARRPVEYDRIDAENGRRQT